MHTHTHTAATSFVYKRVAECAQRTATNGQVSQHAKSITGILMDNAIFMSQFGTLGQIASK